MNRRSAAAGVGKMNEAAVDRSDNPAFVYVVEAYKARSTMNAVLFTAFLTANGYAFAGEGESRIFFILGGLIPVLAFFIDIITKYSYVSPFLYKALEIEFQRPTPTESLPFLFTDYGKGQSSRYAALFAMEPGIKRQRIFRKMYVLRNILFKMLFFAMFSLMDAAFAANLRPDFHVDLHNIFAMM